MSDGKIYTRQRATCDGAAGFGERIEMEVLDMLGYDGPALYITVTPPGYDEDDVEVVLAGDDARRMLRACLAELDREEPPR